MIYTIEKRHVFGCYDGSYMQSHYEVIAHTHRLPNGCLASTGADHPHLQIQNGSDGILQSPRHRAAAAFYFTRRTRLTMAAWQQPKRSTRSVAGANRKKGAST